MLRVSDAPGGEPERPGDFVPMTSADLLVFDALWSGVVNDWDSADRHHKFLEHANGAGALLEAAKRYGALKDDPERGEEAKKRLKAIALLATHELFMTKTEPPRKSPTWLFLLALLVCASLVGVALYWGWGMTQR